MKEKILIIQFKNDVASIESEQATIERELSALADLRFVNALNEVHDWNNPADLLHEFSGVMLCGSAELYFDGKYEDTHPFKATSYELLNKLHIFLSYIFEHDIPTLAICYGHQMLGVFAGATVLCDENQGKTGSYELNLIVDKSEHFLFSDLPKSFLAHYVHKDSLDRVPAGAELIASGGERCRVSALRYKNNIYSTQFHPELTYERILKRIKQLPDYLPEGTAAEEIFKNDVCSNTILHNFGKFVAKQAKTIHKRKIT